MSGVLLAALEFPSRPAFAQADVWTEARVLARAESHSPRVVAARASLLAIRAGDAHARVPFVGNPYVGVRAMLGVPDDAAATYALQFGVPFDLSGLRRAWSTEQHHAVESANAGVQVAQNEARADALQAYADLLLAREAQQNAEQQVQAQQQLLERERSRLEVQAATELDVAHAQQEHAIAQANLASVRAQFEDAAARLREVLDLQPTEEVTTDPPHAPSLPAHFTLERAVRTATEHRREARVHEASARQLRASQDRLRAAAMSPLMVSAEVEVQGNTQRASTVGLSANWSLPIAQTAQGERAVAEGEAVRAETNAQLATRTAAREAAAAWTTLTARLRELELLDREALPAAERTVHLTETLFSSSAADFFRLLLVRRSLYELRARRLDSEREAWRARVALERALTGQR